MNHDNSKLASDELPLPCKSFSDFPEDLQLWILSFLLLPDIANFASTCKRSRSLCRTDDKLWYTICDRRWGSVTQIKKWGSGKISYKLLFKTLEEWQNLLGFWRRSGQGCLSLPSLVYFEWGSSFIAGSRVSPSRYGTYQVVKEPFLWMSLSPDGEVVSLLDPDCRMDFVDEVSNSDQFVEENLAHVSVNFMGRNHVVVEEKQQKYRICGSGNAVDGMDVEDGFRVESGSQGSYPDRMMSEIYQYFANKTSPERALRKQRKREKERQGGIKWDPEHFVKIVNCSPTARRPLQGLWKGICDDMTLDFFLVAYDEVGGIACRRVGEDSCRPFSTYSPVFWTSSTTFMESPFPPEEDSLYESRIHLQPFALLNQTRAVIQNHKVLRILYINSSYDLVIPDLAGKVNPRLVEGRIWQYEDGTCGFGFLRDNFVIDLRHVSCNGRLLDAT